MDDCTTIHETDAKKRLRTKNSRSHKVGFEPPRLVAAENRVATA